MNKLHGILDVLQLLVILDVLQLLVLAAGVGLILSQVVGLSIGVRRGWQRRKAEAERVRRLRHRDRE